MNPPYPTSNPGENIKLNVIPPRAAHPDRSLQLLSPTINSKKRSNDDAGRCAPPINHHSRERIGPLTSELWGRIALRK